ncbi:hypothetical protein PRUPE_2G278600 [Prunus persica]|uniref:F-box domain-containing protein n=1 Tax=Prunus persica TaxID=3760 RepID=A0A251QMN5_PRUPE|nr:F-box/kelch-repeat protein At3g23880 isoform X1 [Prunus persica]XP_020413673.1 F-box/kelch-repeat protein At3g23880 isoform X1 [Prunus persica]ONI25072.1 hypothetical protein PRUPE_2G278600 [Prunus persica]ONI25073.1 hypothetical protein PRUPE_2G278600 [Prunus persica]
MSTKKLHHNRHLPEEIIVQILCRLPIKPLIRFSSVSERWHSLIIEDPQFAQSHFKLASDRKTLTQRLLISTNYQLRSLDPETPSFADNDSSLSNITFHTYTNLLGSCNGLVFVDVDGYENHSLSLWNPSTRFERELPDPYFVSVANTEKVRSEFDRTGLGYVSSTDDYKIFIDAYVYSTPFQKFMEIFSSRLNSWKRIQVRGHDPPCSFRSPTTTSLGALTNEALHWFYSRVGEEEPTILAFDLAKEEFREVPFPTFDGDADDIDVNQMGVQVVSRGEGEECLCVSITRRRGGVNFMEFWVMREYGVRESWNVLFKFNTNDVSKSLGGNFHGYEACFVTEGGTVIFRLRWDWDIVVRIECHREAEPVCSTPFNVNDGDGAVYDVIKYNETLLSVPN